MRGYAAIGLYQPKSNHNVGSALRAAGCFDAKLMVVEGQRYKRSLTDTTKQYRHTPLLHGRLLDLVPFDCVPVAIEIVPGARHLHRYTHPERAFYIFGPEDGSVPKEILERCRDVVQVPTIRCLNLAATVNVVLYDRQGKQSGEDR